MPDIFSSGKKTIKSSEANEDKFIESTLKHREKLTKRKIEKLPGHSHSPLASFCYYPDNVKFINEDPEEVVILLLRKHPITNIKWILTAFLMALVPPLISVLDFFTLLPAGFQFVLILFWYLITTAFMFEKFLGWFFHVNIITDERIIEVDFYHLVYREITDANLDQIQDVTSEMSGALHTFFNFGNVYIQTAGEIPRIQFEDVPQPDRVSRVLRELRIEEEQEKIEGRVR